MCERYLLFYLFIIMLRATNVFINAAFSCSGRELERPSEGPAARVKIPDTEELKILTSVESRPDALTLPAFNDIPTPPPPSVTEETLKGVNFSTSEFTGQCDVTRRICHELSERYLVHIKQTKGTAEGGGGSPKKPIK